MAPAYRVFVVEDWKPVAPALDFQVEQLGHRAVTLPNLIDIVRPRVLRDRPDVLMVNASCGPVGGREEWRRLLAGQTASIIVVPPSMEPRFHDLVRGLGFSGLLDLPVSRGKLDLALQIAVQNRLAARVQRRESQWLTTMHERVVAGEPSRGGRGASAPRE